MWNIPQNMQVSFVLITAFPTVVFTLYTSNKMQ